MKEMDVPADEFIGRACDRLAELAQSGPTFMVFNERRVVAMPGDTVECIRLRWVKAAKK